jgi:hypothetical protein
MSGKSDKYDLKMSGERGSPGLLFIPLSDVLRTFPKRHPFNDIHPRVSVKGSAISPEYSNKSVYCRTIPYVAVLPSFPSR